MGTDLRLTALMSTGYLHDPFPQILHISYVALVNESERTSNYFLTNYSVFFQRLGK
jgi:hypothetical protein